MRIPQVSETFSTELFTNQMILGTGTQAGDPREASAIKAAFFSEYRKGEKLLVGSIKTVIGHTEGKYPKEHLYKANPSQN